MNLGRFWIAFPSLRLPSVTWGRMPDGSWYFWCGKAGLGRWSRVAWAKNTDSNPALGETLGETHEETS